MNTLASHCHAVGSLWCWHMAHGMHTQHTKQVSEDSASIPPWHQDSVTKWRRSTAHVLCCDCLRPIHGFINRKHMHAFRGDKYMHHIIAWICRRYVHTLSPTSNGFLYLLGIYNDVYWLTDMQELCVLYN